MDQRKYEEGFYAIETENFAEQPITIGPAMSTYSIIIPPGVWNYYKSCMAFKLNMAAVGGRKQAIHCSHIPFFNNVTVTGGTTEFVQATEHANYSKMMGSEYIEHLDDNYSIFCQKDNQIRLSVNGVGNGDLTNTFEIYNKETESADGANVSNSLKTNASSLEYYLSNPDAVNTPFEVKILIPFNVLFPKSLFSIDQDIYFPQEVTFSFEINPLNKIAFEFTPGATHGLACGNVGDYAGVTTMSDTRFILYQEQDPLLVELAMNESEMIVDYVDYQTEINSNANIYLPLQIGEYHEMSLLSFFNNNGAGEEDAYNNGNLNCFKAAGNRIEKLLLKYNNKLILPTYDGDSEEFISWLANNEPTDIHKKNYTRNLENDMYENLVIPIMTRELLDGMSQIEINFVGTFNEENDAKNAVAVGNPKWVCLNFFKRRLVWTVDKELKFEDYPQEEEELEKKII